jgi:hypothetical protein
MSEDRVLSDMILAQSAVTAVIGAPIEAIDIAGWLRNLPDKEYQRCAPPDHKAAGYTTADDGWPMSINVEMIGDRLMVQHYVYEIADRQHCHMEGYAKLSLKKYRPMAARNEDKKVFSGLR